MSQTIIPTSLVRWALVERLYPDDIAEQVRRSLRVFHLAPDLYDSPGLKGPAKRAELIIKLAYWLAKGRLTAKEFREWAERIPAEDNEGWDIDLCAASHGSLLTNVLKMGVFVPLQEACLRG
ncbi:MAG TPA: hypothetical protein PLJ99_06955 [Kiritimatiellia bacterium]|nr:hypothetical protein [Kiritimatiellia bacterium]HPJ56620.1 hypothetical protein [Kiritimatiellia bacterium]HPR69012.1 hypothetical protein [Kiritimatiellia bacterium]HRX05799.1 hypothetical protein [Kiritimatiellia bacterium]